MTNDEHEPALSADKPQPKHPSVVDPVVETPDSLGLMANRTQFVIDPNLVSRKWRQMDGVVDAFLDEAITTDSDTTFAIDRIFDHFAGISVLPHLTAMATFHSGMNSYLELYAEEDGQRCTFRTALRIESTLEGFVESMYAFYMLGTKRATWHGLYGRDHVLLLDSSPFTAPSRSIMRPDRFKWVAVKHYSGKLDRPLGIRVSKRRDRYYVSCLAVTPDGSVFDLTVRVAWREVIAIPVERIFISGNMFCY